MKGKLMIFLRKYLTTISNSSSLFISSNPTNDPWKKTFCGPSRPLNKLLWRHWGLKFSPFSSRHTFWDTVLKREIWLVNSKKSIWERRTAVGSYTTMFSWFQQKWWQRSLQSCPFFYTTSELKEWPPKSNAHFLARSFPPVYDWCIQPSPIVLIFPIKVVFLQILYDLSLSKIGLSLTFVAPNV